MAKIKERLEEFRPDPKLVDERGPTAERILRAQGAAVAGDVGTLTMRQSPIDRAHRHGDISDAQERAADKLYSFWKRGGMMGSMGFPSNWEVTARGEGRRDWLSSGNGAFYRDGFVRGMEAVKNRTDAAGHNGDIAVRLLELIVLHETPIAPAGRSVGIEGVNRAGIQAMAILKGALNILVDEWGLL